MAETIKQVKKELKEQNQFLQSMLRSFDDVRHGRIKKFEFSRKIKTS